jgi:hypothetical protein
MKFQKSNSTDVTWAGVGGGMGIWPHKDMGYKKVNLFLQETGAKWTYTPQIHQLRMHSLYNYLQYDFRQNFWSKVIFL